jgi:hypothetical protein
MVNFKLNENFVELWFILETIFYFPCSTKDMHVSVTFTRLA